MGKVIGMEDRLYTRHGKKFPQGVPAIINGEKVLASYRGDEITGYTTLEELIQEFYTRDLPVCEVSNM